MYKNRRDIPCGCDICKPYVVGQRVMQATIPHRTSVSGRTVCSNEVSSAAPPSLMVSSTRFREAYDDTSLTGSIGEQVISRVAKMLGDEFGTASNIKNRVNRQTARESLQRAMPTVFTFQPWKVVLNFLN
eukprot:6064698-Pyramimonas_sp.AAC.1